MNRFRQAERDAADRTNEQIRQGRLAYESTTAPLQNINDTLKDIKLLLNDILVLLKKRV